MAGYLEEYGAGEDRRENLIRNTILITLAVIVIGGLSFYIFRPFHQIRLTHHFLSLVREKNYPAAYAAWGCTGAPACHDYPYEKFLEDWGSKSAAAANPILRITDAESCDTGEIMSVDVSPNNPQKLFVEKSSDALSFSPVQVCPGKSSWAIMAHRTIGRLRHILF